MIEFRTFHSDQVFGALREVEAFLVARGFSVGSWQRGAPCAVMHGDYDISKWRNLSKDERRETHAIISGDGRNGPIKLSLLPACPDVARAALSQERPA